MLGLLNPATSIPIAGYLAYKYFKNSNDNGLVDSSELSDPRVLPASYWNDQEAKAKAEEKNWCNIFIGGEASKENIYIPHDLIDKDTWANANGMIQFMEKSDLWGVVSKVDGALDHAKAQKMASDYFVVFGYNSESSDPNNPGHLARIIAGEMTYSGGWNRDVPAARGSVGGKDPVSGNLGNQITPTSENQRKYNYYYYKKKIR